MDINELQRVHPDICPVDALLMGCLFEVKLAA
jgi:hypothetical protein